MRTHRTYGELFRRRALAALVVFALMAVLGVVQLTRIQLISGGTYSAEANEARTVDRTLQGVRGTITDVNNVTLAQSIESYTVFADQQAASSFEPVACKGRNNGMCQETANGKVPTVTGPAAVAQLIAPILGMDVKTLGAAMTGTSRYVVLKRNVLPAVKRQIDKLNISSVIGFQTTSNREYSDDSLLGTILGGVDNTGKGVAGIELMENASLDGVNGHIVYQRGGNGQEIPGTRTESTEPKNGGTVRLTIDRDVQWYVKTQLVDGFNSTHAKYGIAVVQRVSDGQILAIADTDNYAAGSTEAKINVSRAITGTFEPGSTGKVLTAAGLLQEGLQTPQNKFSVPYSIDVDGQTFHDALSHPTKQLTMAGILRDSSNVGMIEMSKNYSYDKRLEYIKRFGIGETSGIGFPGESAGQIVEKASDWDVRTRNAVLFGQGYAVTALQMTNVIATIANKGMRNYQSLIYDSTDANGNKTTPQKKAPVRVIDENHASDLMNMMETVAANIRRVNVPGYRVAGKTGTAEVSDGGGALTGHIADFIGVIPADNPQFVVTVVYRDPEGLYGDVTATPVFSKIGEFLMQKYQIPTSAPRTNIIAPEW